MALNDLIKKLENTSVTVIGDVMLDIFVYGHTHRQSPEAPVPVLLTGDENIMPGGAANVAANVAALGARTRLLGVVGDDDNARTLRSGMRRLGVSDEMIIDSSRPTTIKTRYVSQHGQIVRVDTEQTQPIASMVAEKIIGGLNGAIDDGGVIILSDYAKGVLSAEMIRRVMDMAAAKNIPVIVDPKGTDYTKYKGAFTVTPNRKELAEATGMAADTDDQVVAAARALMEKTGIQQIVAKRSEQGISVIPRSGAPIHIKTAAKDVRDVSGAGDTVVAALAVALAAGETLEHAARFANDAAAIAVAKPGTSIVRADELGDHTPAQNYISPVMQDWGDAGARIRAWQAQGFKVGFTNGCFDIIHYGHVNYLNQARGRCDKLVLGLNHDASVRILKGPTRPVNDEMARATVMAALGSVDMVVFFGAVEKGQDNTPCDLIDAIRPDVFFKGGDYTIDQLPEAKVVQAYGGAVDIMPLYEGYSTTSIIEKTKNDKEQAA